MDFNELLEYAGSIVGPREAEAGVASSAKKLLQTPISRRQVLKQGMKEVVFPRQFPKSVHKKGLEQLVAMIEDRGGSDSAGELVTFWPYMEEYYKAGIETYKKWLRKDHPWLDEKSINRLVALGKAGKQVEAYKMYTHKTFENLRPSKVDFLKAEREATKGIEDWGLSEDIGRVRKQFREGLSKYGFNWDTVGRPIASAESKMLDELADSIIEKSIQAGTKVGKEVGKTELTRRQFLGLRAKSKVKSLLDALKATEEK